jgi:transcriptional regulator with XRE-family HTH domain
MRQARRVAARNQSVVEAWRIAATLGSVIRSGRRRLGLSQEELGRKVGLSQSRVSAIERGLGAGITLELWVAFGLALRQPLAVSFSRPTRPDDALADAGHREIQEYLLEIRRRSGRREPSSCRLAHTTPLRRSTSITKTPPTTAS